MLKEHADISWFVTASYGAAFALLAVFTMLCVVRRLRVRKALRESNVSIPHEA